MSNLCNALATRHISCICFLRVRLRQANCGFDSYAIGDQYCLGPSNHQNNASMTSERAEINSDLIPFPCLSSNLSELSVALCEVNLSSAKVYRLVQTNYRFSASPVSCPFRRSCLTCYVLTADHLTLCLGVLAMCLDLVDCTCHCVLRFYLLSLPLAVAHALAGSF